MGVFDALAHSKIGVADLRVADPQGQNVPYLIDWPARTMESSWDGPIAQDVQLEKSRTVVVLTVDPDKI